MNNRVKKVIITGPESVGKTFISTKLAAIFKGAAIPEYARDYIGELDRPYNEEDVILVAKKQLEQYNFPPAGVDWIFYDTWLIVTKVWLDVVYGKSYEWIDHAIQASANSMYLLLSPDIPWEEDPLRENGGEMRTTLFETYKGILQENNLPFRVISGEGDARLQSAVQAIEQQLNI